MAAAAANGKEEVLPLHAREDKHHGADAGDHQRGAEVGLLHDQQHEDDGHHGGAQQRVAPVLHLVEPRGQEPGEKENDHRLGDFRRLKGRSAEADPAMGMVRVVKEQHQESSRVVMASAG